MQLLMIAVPSREAGLEGLDRLAAAVAAGRIDVEGAALVTDGPGGAGIHRLRAGGSGGRERDADAGDRLLQRAARLVDGHEAVLFVLADDVSTVAIAARVEGAMSAGGRLSYRVVPPDDEEALRDAIGAGIT